MSKAHQDGIVPIEQFAKRGVQSAKGVLATGLFCDIVCALDCTASAESVDLTNCYDAVAHSMAAIALQSFRVRIVMVAMMLSVLQDMDFFLHTAFRQSTLTYGGTKQDPTMGLTKGNGAAPPGFLAVRTFIIGTYERLGHGTGFIGA